MEKTGDFVKVTTADDVSEGVLMPSQKEYLVVIKLDSGYNKAIRKDHVKNVEVLESYKPLAEKPVEEVPRSGLPTIAILHTGGTIASKVDYRTGGVTARFTPAELLEMFPELRDVANIRSRLISNMWSEDMRFAHYNLMAQAIKEQVQQGCKGVIITHGTDTLHYSAAALSFMFESLPIPVILVGSQRSSDRGSSDAAMNVICAARFITQTNFSDVAICMHAASDDLACVILPGTKTRKMHATRRDAFEPINALPWAHVSFEDRTITWLRNDWKQGALNDTKADIVYKPFKEDLRIAIIKTHPNMNASQFSAYKGYDGVIIEGFGLGGHAPINAIDMQTKEHHKIAESIKALIKGGTLVAAATQTVYGRVNMNVYSTGRDMKSMGVIGDGHDMTSETAFIKLAWLLSNYPKKDVPDLFIDNLHGEISSRSLYEEHDG
ncbi:Glu-tRNA(Gln) amidotransferase subunit GatD [Candidatus Woesearchaeota archaeon]|nr:Glu-tRNA(Gln) amidotransferase subunit GatD [Candidatus Woesearchaeota archaeon]